jgi:hypothetical protein
MEAMDVPPTLRTWFVVHAVVDVVAAVPLFIAPAAVLGRLGWTCVDPVAPRLVAAALLAIGGQSFLGRNAGVEAYRSMLGLKVIWSLAAAIGLFASIGDGAPPAAWAFLSLFIGFAGVWTHHAIRFRQHDHAPADRPDAALVDEQDHGPEGEHDPAPADEPTN